MIEFKNNVIKYKSHKKIIFISLIVSSIILIIVFVAMYLLKYQVEGEKKLPFELKKMLIISTADGIGKDDQQNRWNLSILQNNDIYIEIKKVNDERRNDSLKKITLENFIIDNGPTDGEPKIYRPVNDKDLIYLYKEENQINEKIEYNVATKSNVKKLDISRDGGIVSFSSCSENIASYISNDDIEVKYDGSLLNKVGINEEDVKYDITFNIVVEMESKKKYKATMKLSLPLENLIKEGTVKKEIQDFSDIIFKRV